MEKQTKITYILVGLSVLSVILHNAFYGLFKIEEPVFFILTFVFAISFVISVIYSTISYFKKGEPKDLWKLGWIGFLGLLGLIPTLSYGFFGFFGFLGFFGAKSWKTVKGSKNETP
jgi:Mn2+/Fe2+ NRAMP family transporter